MRVAAAVSEITGDDSMVIAGGIHPYFVHGQEGKLRASAIVVEEKDKVCIVSCDVLMLQREIIDEVCKKIEAECGISPKNILIASTHTHHAPSTVVVHGYSADQVFCKRLREGILSSVRTANERLDSSQGVKSYFWVGSESSVGQNSRLLLGDGTIYWVGPMDDVLRSTAPIDPDLPVLAFKSEDGKMRALLFNHSTHNIGTRVSGVRSPGFYGLVAQEFEDELGGTSLFLPGAFGSTHNLTLSADEMALRMKNAIKEALSKARSKDITGLRSLKEEFMYRVREFDEEKEQEAVAYYCNKRLSDPGPTIDVFRNMRNELSKHQGEIRKTWLQVMLLGDIAFVGVPGELFTTLGIDIKRLSPYRYTYVVGLANDWIGYIPDGRGFDLGGYQVWTGFHSYVAKGTGEALVKEVVRMLSSLKNSESQT